MWENLSFITMQHKCHIANPLDERYFNTHNKVMSILDIEQCWTCPTDEAHQLKTPLDLRFQFLEQVTIDRKRCCTTPDGRLLYRVLIDSGPPPGMGQHIQPLVSGSE